MYSIIAYNKINNYFKHKVDCLLQREKCDDQKFNMSSWIRYRNWSLYLLLQVRSVQLLGLTRIGMTLTLKRWDI